MPNVQPIKSVNVAGTVHPLDSVFTVLSGISTVAGSASSSSYKSVRWYVSGIEGITEPYDGMKLAIKVPLAGVATAGAVLSINGDVNANYHPLAYNINTALTTHFPVNSIKIFTYDANQTMDCYLTAKTKVTITGVWKAESNYDSNSNSIGYQVRTNTAIYKNGASTACYRYQILVETENGLEAFTSTNNQTGTTKTQLSPKYIPNGTIRYYSSTTTVASDSNFGATVLWQQYQGIDLRYSFNIATITTNSPCYIKMSRNDDGTLSPVYSATSAGHPLVFALPSTNDGYYYTYLGRTYTSSNVVYLELELDHPTFYYDGGINIYNGKESEYALVIDEDEFNASTGDRTFTDAEIAILKNSNKPIKLTGVTCDPDALTKEGFALLYKNIHDIGTRVEALGGNFDDIIYSTVMVMLGVLIKTGIYINCNTKVGERISIALTTNTQFNNSLPSFTEHHQYYVPSAVGNDGQFLISTGDINDPFSYSDIRTLDTTATSAQATNASEAITGSGKITLHKVSKTGNYNDLLNKPTIPTNTNQKVKAKNSGTDVTFGDNAVVEIKAGTNVQVAANATDNTITISSTDTNTTYTVASGDGNGQIKVTPSSGNAYNVDVKGLGSAAYKSTGTASGNVPVLDSNGKLAESVIPAVAITDTYEADSQTAMLALTAQKGDICIRSDLNKSFVLQTTPASTLANWKELKTPTDAVLSVNEQTGAVTLDAADVGAATSTHKHSYTPAGSVSLGSNDTASGGVAYIASVSGTSTSGTPTTKYLHKTTANASPNAHTHTVVVSGTTEANSGTAVAAVTGYNSFSGGTGALTSVDSQGTGDIAYISAVSGGSAVSPTTKYFHPSFTGTEVTSGGNSGTGIAAVTGYPNFNGGDATTKYLTVSYTAGTAVKGGTTQYMHWAAGTTPPASASFSGTATTALVTGVAWHSTNTKVLYGSRTTSGSGTAARRTLEVKAYDLSVTKGSYTPAGTVSFTDGTAPSLTFNTTSTGGQAYVKSLNAVSSVGGSVSLNSDTSTSTGAISYIASHTSASLGTPTTGTAAPNAHTHSVTAAGTVNLGSNTTSTDGVAYISTISGGTEVNATTKYLHHTHSGASLGSPTTKSVAPNGHTHSYGSSTALPTSANSGSAVAAITGLTVNEEQTTGDIKYLENYAVSGGTVSGTTKYFHPSFSGTAKDTGEPK